MACHRFRVFENFDVQCLKIIDRVTPYEDRERSRLELPAAVVMREGVGWDSDVHAWLQAPSAFTFQKLEGHVHLCRGEAIDVSIQQGLRGLWSRVDQPEAGSASFGDVGLCFNAPTPDSLQRLALLHRARPLDPAIEYRHGELGTSKATFLSRTPVSG